MLRVDKEGIPCLVQFIKYWYNMACFELHLLNGSIFFVDGDIVHMGLLQHIPSDEQYWDIETWYLKFISGEEYQGRLAEPGLLLRS